MSDDEADQFMRDWGDWAKWSDARSMVQQAHHLGWSARDSEVERLREALELVRDCSSLEWQQPDGKRMGATDNQGRRMWFITEDVMEAALDALSSQVKESGK